MSSVALPVLISWTLSAIFAVAGLAHILWISRARAAYARWNFPRGFNWVTASFELLAAIFLALPQTRIWGVAVAGVILFIAVVTLLNHRQYAYALPGMILLAALPPALLAAAG
jgi:hypothetical protein